MIKELIPLLFINEILIKGKYVVIFNTRIFPLRKDKIDTFSEIDTIFFLNGDKFLTHNNIYLLDW